MACVHVSSSHGVLSRKNSIVFTTSRATFRSRAAPSSLTSRDVTRSALTSSPIINVSSSPSSPVSTVADVIPDSEISITKTSFGTIGLTVGVGLLSYGFGAYFTLLPGTEWSAIMLTYGFPLMLIGFALKYAELKPVECVSYSDAVALRATQATDIQVQVRSDVTRYRYGDEQHLEEALQRIFRYGLQGGIQRRNAPKLSSIAEQVYDGRYSLVLKFNAPQLQQKDFTDRQEKFTSFFGPGVTAMIEEEGEKQFNVRLVSIAK